MGNTRTKNEDRSMPVETRCPCMGEESWDAFSSVMGASVGRIVREGLDSSGTCEKGTRDILVSIVVASIMAAEGENGVRDIDTILASVKERMVQQ